MLLSELQTCVAYHIGKNYDCVLPELCLLTQVTLPTQWLAFCVSAKEVLDLTILISLLSVFLSSLRWDSSLKSYVLRHQNLRSPALKGNVWGLGLEIYRFKYLNTLREHCKNKWDYTFCRELLFLLAWRDDHHTISRVWELHRGILPNIPRYQTNQIAPSKEVQV